MTTDLPPSADYADSIEGMASALREAMLAFRLAENHALADRCDVALTTYYRAKIASPTTRSVTP